MNPLQILLLISQALQLGPAFIELVKQLVELFKTNPDQTKELIAQLNVMLTTAREMGMAEEEHRV